VSGVEAGAVPVLAVDGPGGAGKGTLCRRLRERTGWHLLDSGAIYRALAVAVGRDGQGLDDTVALGALARRLDLTFPPAAEDDDAAVLLDGEDVSARLRSEATAQLASRLAVMPAVREALLQRQRDFRRAPGLIADGRDMGSVVFPDACLKVFLTASAEERAGRRYKQLKKKGVDANLAVILQDIEERDRRDRSRAAAPLLATPDALEIDTTGLAIEAVVDRVWSALDAVLRSQHGAG
jgi:CMP/dCMP kinase